MEIPGSKSDTKVTELAPPVSPPGKWQNATVVDIRTETATAKTFRLALAAAAEYLAGQHYLVRLTAPDGYSATRSYSVASAPDGSKEIELTVERLSEGEVSSFLHDEVVIGDTLEVRGPIGGWFVWRGDAPALLVGGGSGIVPLMAMLRLARRMGRPELVHLVISIREPEDLYYASELSGSEIQILYTRRAPEGWPRPPARLRPEDLPSELAPGTMAYVCGSSGFSDAATDALASTGIEEQQIRVERFGPTG
jgi:ferredoxin-NADP reductase